MKTRIIIFGAIVCLQALLANCSSPYHIVEIDKTVVKMDSAWQPRNLSPVEAFYQPYKTVLDAQLDVPVAYCDSTLVRDYPNGILTNLTCDAMLAFGESFLGEPCHIAMMNTGGLRTSLSAGTVYLRTLWNIYSFDNYIEILEIRGDILLQALQFMVTSKNAGVSTGTHISVVGDKIAQATIDQQFIDKNRTYRLVTLDYLSGGGDSYQMLKAASKVIQTETLLRDVMIDFMKQQTSAGRHVAMPSDARIVIE